ncbi:putative organic solute transporter Ostalpha [Lyophyllum shimeji]|uniref:Organic solute transporter Ostalpha n=1 Tax=Lyophyllum shimeji TaxID=47721 RepID=A0A9P3PKI3_LYOSH|nr:putative organic solute transporter Ostalpha [Lyophyllum shimeji]
METNPQTMSTSGGRCYKARAQDGPALIQNGNVVFQAYHVGWIIAGFFAMVATGVSFWLVDKHLQWYTNKREQRYIVRILFMVPIYALVSFASFLFWNHATILVLIRDGYESTVLTAFFYLLLMYLSHDPEEQKSIFLKAGLSREADRQARKTGEVKKWVFPLGFIKWKPHDGLYFLQLMKWGVLQYCVIRPTTTLAAVILDYMGLYCEESWALGWGHVYITIIVSLSVTIAMYCLIQLYVSVADYLAPHRALLKLFAIKAVVFLTFWQATFLSVLSMFGVVKDTKYMTAADINIGIGAVLETVEMTLFAFLHIRAFTYRIYRPFNSPDSAEPEPERTPRLRSLVHAMDLRETLREIWIGCIYIWDKLRGKEPTPDVGARRIAHYEGAFGRPRASRFTGDNGNGNSVAAPEERPTLPAVKIAVDEEVDVDIEGEKQWLGLGDDYGYGLGYIKREKSDDLAVQIERELKKRGYTTDIAGRGHIGPPPDVDPGEDARRQASWWRRIYNRFSEHESEHEDEQGMSLMTHKSKRRSRRHWRGSKVVERDSLEPDIDDPPPPSLTRQHRNLRDSQLPSATEDILAPLPIFQDPRIPRQRGPPRIELPNLSSPSSDGVSLDTGAHATISPPTESSHADSLLGRIFPRTAKSQPTDLEMTGVGPFSVESMDEEAHARLSKAARNMLGQYYEFGVSAVEMSASTHHRYRDPQGPSTVRVIEPTYPSQSLHCRESAQHGSSVADSSPLRTPAPASTSSPRKEVPLRPQELNIQRVVPPPKVYIPVQVQQTATIREVSPLVATSLQRDKNPLMSRPDATVP